MKQCLAVGKILVFYQSKVQMVNANLKEFIIPHRKQVQRISSKGLLKSLLNLYLTREIRMVIEYIRKLIAPKLKFLRNLSHDQVNAVIQLQIGNFNFLNRLKSLLE